MSLMTQNQKENLMELHQTDIEHQIKSLNNYNNEKMELIERLIPAGDDGIRVMVLTTIIIFVLFLVLFGASTKFFYGVWKSDKLMVQELHDRADKHDKEHIEINNNIYNQNRNIESILKEIAANRKADNDRADVTRKLLTFMAKKAKIEIPEL